MTTVEQKRKILKGDVDEVVQELLMQERGLGEETGIPSTINIQSSSQNSALNIVLVEGQHEDADLKFESSKFYQATWVTYDMLDGGDVKIQVGGNRWGSMVANPVTKKPPTEILVKADASREEVVAAIREEIRKAIAERIGPTGQQLLNAVPAAGADSTLELRQ